MEMRKTGRNKRMGGKGKLGKVGQEEMKEREERTGKPPPSPHLVLGAALKVTDDVSGVGAAELPGVPGAPALRRPPPHRPRTHRRAARVSRRPGHRQGGGGGV